MNELWTEKYRPKKLEDYVTNSNNMTATIKEWIKTGNVPHVLFSGPAGTGKTTLAKIIFHELDVDPADILEINASSENGVDIIRERITNFSSMMPFGEFKYVLLDEADFLTPNGQAALRGVMEKYSTTVRFILTCNYPNKVIPAIHSRCQGFHIEKLDVTEFTVRVATILQTENTEFDLDVIDTYIKATYPDLRKCINLLQMNSQGGVLQSPEEKNTSTSDYKLQMIELFKQGNIREARKLIVAQIRPEEYDDMFKFMYQNLELWSKTEDGQDQAIVIIARYLKNDALVADREINLSACLCELSNI